MRIPSIEIYDIKLLPRIFYDEIYIGYINGTSCYIDITATNYELEHIKTVMTALFGKKAVTLLVRLQFNNDKYTV